MAMLERQSCARRNPRDYTYSICVFLISGHRWAGGAVAEAQRKIFHAWERLGYHPARKVRLGSFEVGLEGLKR